MATLSSPTLQELITEVRALLNQQDNANSTWSDEQLTRWLNEAVRRYFQEVTMHAEGWFAAQTDLNITTDTDTVALPSDFYEVRAVYKKVSDGYILLPYRNNLTEGYTTQGGSSSNNYLPYYYFRQNNLVLRPTPNFSETAGLRIEYIQFPDTMVNGGDSLTNQVSPIFRDLIIMFAVYKAKLQESLVTGVATHANAAQELEALARQWKDAVIMRSKNPQFTIPYNPETEGL